MFYETTGIYVNNRNAKIRLSAILTGSPVPIFTTGEKRRKTESHLAYFFPRDKEQELRNFIEQRWAEMQEQAKQG